MQITLHDNLAGTAEGEEAKAIIGKCVHCGFCTATCPTYQLLGDELDGPRGRIYLMKQVLEGQPVSASTRTHLDRCLTCRNCESTCPSGVDYGRLVDIGRKVVEDRLDREGTRRPLSERLTRWALREGLSRPRLFQAAYGIGQTLRPLLPRTLKYKVTPYVPPVDPTWKKRTHRRKMLMLEGCVQPAMSPNINGATARVLDKIGIELLTVSEVKCCGAVRLHTGDPAGAYVDIKRNIDAWWPHLEAGAEAIVINASGCGITVKEYGQLLKDDPVYAERARAVSQIARDLSEIVADEHEAMAALARGLLPDRLKRVAYHPPCTLQHGQKLRGKVESILAGFGIDVLLCAESHLCCGSAGTYSVLQPKLATMLRDRKLAQIEKTAASAIVSANIGCISHLQSGTGTPVMHWIELIDRCVAEQPGKRAPDSIEQPVADLA